MLLEPRARPRLMPWILLSGGLHAGLALSLWIAGMNAAPETPDLRPIRLTLLRDTPGTGAPEAAPPPPAPARPAPAPRRVTPRPAPVAAPAPAPVAEASAETSDAAPDENGARGGTATVAAVSAGPPGAGGTPGGDPLAAYIARVRASIARHKRYPDLARRRGIEGRVLLRLAIAPDGSLVESEAVDSPSAVLARSALSAVEAASPFEPPPAGSLRIEVPIRFDLKE